MMQHSCYAQVTGRVAAPPFCGHTSALTKRACEEDAMHRHDFIPPSSASRCVDRRGPWMRAGWTWIAWMQSNV